MRELFKAYAQRNVALLCALTLLFLCTFTGCGKSESGDKYTTTDLFKDFFDEEDSFEEGVEEEAEDAEEPVRNNKKSASAAKAKTKSGSKKSSASSQKQSAKSTGAKTEKKTKSAKSDDVFDDAEELQEYLDESEKESQDSPKPDRRLIKWYIDENGYITTEGDKGILGFGYSINERCFYATGNAWQRNFGYTQLYDKVSELMVISYDTIRVYFTYDNKDWMIQLWKGQYGFVLEGGEVGVYNRPHSFNITTYYNCATDNDRLPISLTLYDKGRKRFSRAAQTSWWMTGFVPGQLGLGVGVGSLLTQLLTETTTITLKDEIMRDAFVAGLKNVKTIFNNVDYAAALSNNILINPGERLYSFKEGDGLTANRLAGTYKINGNSVTLTWK